MKRERLGLFPLAAIQRFHNSEAFVFCALGGHFVDPTLLTVTQSCHHCNFHYSVMYDLDVVNESSMLFFLICPNLAKISPQIPKFLDKDTSKVSSNT